MVMLPSMVSCSWARQLYSYYRHRLSRTSNLFWDSDNDAILQGQRIREDLYNLQPRRFQQCVPLVLGTFH